MTDLIKSNLFNFPTLFDARAMSKLFEDFDRDLWESRSGYPYNVIQKGDTTILKYALAGFTKDDIKVNVSGDTLNIEAVADAEKESEDIKYLHRGIAERSLKVYWELGARADKKNIKSSFEDGMLIIEIPVKPLESIDIKVG